MSAAVKLTGTLEDYVEAIARIVSRKSVARVKEIADALGVHKSTATAALKRLGAAGFVNHSPYGAVTLTRLGAKRGNEILARHRLLRRFLEEILLVPAKKADANACRLEHVLDKDVLKRLENYVSFVEKCPRAGVRWIRGFDYYCDEGFDESRCRRCLELAIEDLEKRPSDQQPIVGEKATMATLDQMKPGQKAKVVRVERKGPATRRIADMGVVRGAVVEVVKVAPLGDPIEIKVKGYNLSLRKSDAAGITVEPE